MWSWGKLKMKFLSSSVHTGTHTGTHMHTHAHTL